MESLASIKDHLETTVQECLDGLANNKGDGLLYQYKDRVSYSRIDTEGKLKVHAVVNALQDCSLFHSEEVGLSCMDLKKDSHAWLVNSWHIVFNRRPSMGEEFIIKTWPYKFHGIFGMRNFVIESNEGETLVYADSQWFYFDQSTGKPVKPTMDEVTPFGMEDPYPMEYTSRKVKYPDDIERQGVIRVCENHMDTNSHVNNGEYIRIAANYLPAGFKAEELRVEYRLAAKLGDDIYINTKQTEDGFYVVMTDIDNAPYVITYFQGHC